MSTKLKVAIAAPRGRACGVGDHAAFLAESLGSDLDWCWLDLPTVPSPRAWNQAAARADRSQVIHVHFEPSLFNIPRPYVNRFATFMKRLQPPALVSLHDALPRLSPRWGEPKPYGFSDLFRDLAYLPFFLPWENAQYKRADHWLVHSPELAARVGNLAGPERVSQMLMPVPPVGRVWSLQEDHPLDLISPGFFKAHKGYRDLLDLLPGWPSLTWALAGGPQDDYDRAFADHLKARIRQLGLASRVRMTGYLTRTGLEELATQAKAAIFPFQWAAGSASLTWAMGLGLPVLATDLPALAQFKAAGAGLKLLPQHNRGRWAELIESVLNDPAEQAMLSKANLNFARNHSYAEFARQVKGLYRQLAGRGSRV